MPACRAAAMLSSLSRVADFARGCVFRRPPSMPRRFRRDPSFFRRHAAAARRHAAAAARQSSRCHVPRHALFKRLTRCHIRTRSTKRRHACRLIIRADAPPALRHYARCRRRADSRCRFCCAADAAMPRLRHARPPMITHAPAPRPFAMPQLLRAAGFADMLYAMP